MKRLLTEDNNSPEEYAKLQKIPIDWFELKRWKELLIYWRGGNLIDLGASGGLSPIFAKARYPYAEITALDYAYEYPKQYLSGIEYIKGDVYDTKLKSGHYHYAIMGQLLEHLEKPQQAIHEAARLLKKGGTLAISVPYKETEAGEIDNHHHIWSLDENDLIKMTKTFSSYSFKIIRSEYLPKYHYHFPYLLFYAKK